MAIARQLILGIDPANGESFTVAFADVPDGNTEQKFFLCGYCPPQKGLGISVMQESVFLGTSQPVGRTYQAFLDALSLDDLTPITGRVVTHRIDPEARADANALKNATTKRYLKLILGGDNPMQANEATIEWLKDEDPLGPMATWQPIAGDADDTVLHFESGLANFIHLKIEDASMVVNRIVLPPFSIGFYSIGDRDVKDRR